MNPSRLLTSGGMRRHTAVAIVGGAIAACALASTAQADTCPAGYAERGIRACAPGGGKADFLWLNKYDNVGGSESYQWNNSVGVCNTLDNDRSTTTVGQMYTAAQKGGLHNAEAIVFNAIFTLCPEYLELVPGVYGM